ncbi:hypothetical protein ABEB36_008034 [Hypothenemus hampei]|uniref:Uncharacterized protein n=1 Tax=Hypothenemus hampei TaxID=57062 RepID=A0ABD1EPK2_HYPHA
MQHLPLSDCSEDEIMGRLCGKEKRATSSKNVAHYSKQDILEQYCISEKGFGALENGRYNFFGCLSSRNSSFCSASNAPSILTACVRQRVSSDENLYELYKRNASDYAPFPKRQRYPWSPIDSEIYAHDRELKSTYFRRKTYTDPSRYTWMLSDDESVRMEKPKSISDLSHRSQIPPSKKHVSFARSYTLTSFDDAMSSLSSSLSHLNSITKSQERLLEVRKAQENQAITKQPEFSDNKVLLDKLKRGPMKTQATQTEANLGRKLVHPNLSPGQRVKMVSQAAQTNGLNGRKLLKSLSEVSCNLTSLPQNSFQNEHVPLHRTQSDEPPKSPYIDTSPKFLPPQEEQIQSESSSISKSDEHGSEDSVETKKEIFIDFKPQVQPFQGDIVKKQLMKTFSDGLILTEKRKAKISDDRLVPIMRSYGSISNDKEILAEVPVFEPHFRKKPIKNEGICKKLEENIYSSIDEPQDLVLDEEFHENIIYSKEYDRYEPTSENNLEIINEGSPPDESIVPSIFLTADQTPSPFASSDSLANDTRDHSDGIWNESQVTVVQIESSPDNEAATKSSQTTSDRSSGLVALLTPKSKRKYLLMLQHQQRSSIDIDTLEEEVIEQEVQSEFSNKLKVPSNLKITTKQSPQRIKSSQTKLLSPPSRRKRSDSPPITAESPLPAVVPDIHLGQIDSCKTNTDLSESTTTDDYITANSGTDSSRKSISFQKSDQKRTVCESTKKQSSSTLTKESLDNFLLEDMVVPSIPKSLSSESHGVHAEFPFSATNVINTTLPQISTGRSTPSDDSSSCGSYSVGGSTPDILERLSDNEEYTTRKKRKDFYLDVTNSSGNYKSKGKHTNVKISPQKENLKVGIEKVKRPKARTRSPLQGQKKAFYGRRSPHKDKSLYSDDKSYKATSDESSTGREYTASQISPRKLKKSKEILRRRSLPRSPVGQKSQKKIETDSQPSSLPGSLSRRKSTKTSKQAENMKNKNKSFSKAECHKNAIAVKESTTLKALSAESLRSISPGSDSVFYSDPSSYTVEHQMHCLHCGKEVDVPLGSSDKIDDVNEQEAVIVKPPAGFEDSPKIKVGRYKKQESRIRTDEKIEHRRHRYKPEIRAKSEERSGATGTIRSRLRPMQRSPYCSKEHLKAADSSPSILPGAPEEDNDQGVYQGCYTTGKWLCISDSEIFNAVLSPTESTIVKRSSLSSTESEHEFCKRYQGVTHRVAHRKPYVDMYKRIYFKSFDCDKTIVVQRESGEFGFRIHGSKPVVVTAIEPGTPAESSGLEVGDIIIAVNGINVMDRSHSDVVQIAQSQHDTLTLDIARTSYALNTVKQQPEIGILFSGYLWKLSGYARGNTTNKWTRRWFCLKKDNCLYYYKTDSDKQPVGVLMLLDHEIRELEYDFDQSKPNSFVIHKDGTVSLYLAADTLDIRSKWIETINKSMNEYNISDDYLEETKRNLTLSPSSINDPECLGYLIKLGTQWKSWNRRFCVLKNAALYFYHDSNATNAFGGFSLLF